MLKESFMVGFTILIRIDNRFLKRAICKTSLKGTFQKVNWVKLVEKESKYLKQRSSPFMDDSKIKSPKSLQTLAPFLLMLPNLPQSQHINIFVTVPPPLIYGNV